MEDPFPSGVIYLFSSILFIALVWLDKQIVFRKVTGMERRIVCQARQFQPPPVNHQEHMLWMKKFSTSDMHFKITSYITLGVLGLGFLLFKDLYSGVMQDSLEVIIKQAPNVHSFEGQTNLYKFTAHRIFPIFPLLPS